jgi:NADH dehydrogenase (ubiquinone) Fe-S protein 3
MMTRECMLICQGYSEVRYDEQKKRVVYEPLQLTQAYR